MDKEELKERVIAHLRSLDVGETVSVEGIAEEIGEPLSDVNMAVDAMLTERLLFQHGTIGDRAYSLTSRGRHYGEAKDAAPMIEDPPADKPVEGPEAPEEEPTAPEPKNPKQCRHCKKVLCDSKYRAKHEEKCPKNPKNIKPVEERKLRIPEPSLPKKLCNVPAPKEYAGDARPVTPTPPPVHEYVPDLPSFSPNGALCHRCEHSITELIDPESGAMHHDCAANCRTEAECKARHKFVSPPKAMATAEEVRKGEELKAELNAEAWKGAAPAAGVAVEVLALKGSPGMSMAMRLLSCCQRAVDDHADLTLDASVKVAEGLYVNIHLDVPVEDKEAAECK